MKAPAIASSEMTPQSLYLNRREFLFTTLAISKRMVTTNESVSPRETITTFNNFYEFGTDKADPAKNSKAFKPKPWSVAVEGLCNKPGSYALEERVYRHRCVEGWSLVIPWVGFPLGDMLKRFEPQGSAAFVEFTTVMRPEEMPGQRRRWLSPLAWPYVEGLRMDEAMHPLAILAVGLYGDDLLNQNGTPLRLVVPWKYGFKSIKSIVKIRFVDKQPRTSWERSVPEYYGFYSNVNPGSTNSTFKDQSTERRLGEFFMRKTLPFNGYANEVGGLYAGMDLRKNF